MEINEKNVTVIIPGIELIQCDGDPWDKGKEQAPVVMLRAKADLWSNSVLLL